MRVQEYVCPYCLCEGTGLYLRGPTPKTCWCPKGRWRAFLMARVNSKLRMWAAVKARGSGAERGNRRGGPPEAIGAILGRIKPAGVAG